LLTVGVGWVDDGGDRTDAAGVSGLVLWAEAVSVVVGLANEGLASTAADQSR
jgi:hypothetical protein